MILRNALVALALLTHTTAAKHNLRRQLGGHSNDSSSEDENYILSSSQIAETTYVVADRVGALDRSGAKCAIQAPKDPKEPFALTYVEYYYRIESNVKVSKRVIRLLEDKTWGMVRPHMLWCTQSGADGPSIDVGSRRFLTYDDARRLGISSVAHHAQDYEVAPAIFGGLDACEGSPDPWCMVMRGQVAIRARESDILTIPIASILDGTETAMVNDMLTTSFSKDCMSQDSLCSVRKVTWLGSSAVEVMRNGAVGGSNSKSGSGGDFGGTIIEDSSSRTTDSSDNGRDVPILFYAFIPMALLLVLALLIARNKRQRRQVVTRTAALAALSLEDATENRGIVGTGDPPRSFHHGDYHYTRSGARYLSTNCDSCADTRRGVFSVDPNLETISEDHLYDPQSPAHGSTSSLEDSSIELSFDDSEAADGSQHRKLKLVKPNSKDLGRKASTVDVHQCSSATCRICSFQPQNVSFMVSPGKETVNPPEGMGESRIV